MRWPWSSNRTDGATSCPSTDAIAQADATLAAAVNREKEVEQATRRLRRQRETNRFAEAITAALAAKKKKEEHGSG